MIRTDEGLPFTRCSRVTRELGIGLETHFSSERGLYFSLIASRSIMHVSAEIVCDNGNDEPWEQSATELCFNEELGVEHLWGGIERSSRDTRVHMISSSNSMAGI